MRWILNITNSQVFAQRNNKKNGKRYSHIISNPGDYIICKNLSEGNHICTNLGTLKLATIWRRRAWWAGLATWRPLPQKFSLNARGLLTKKYTFSGDVRYAEQSLLEWLLFAMGYCYRLSPKQSHKSVILHAAVSHQIKFFLQRCVCYLSGIQPH